jgi:hypothetical protein
MGNIGTDAALTGIAGVHWVVSELSRRGLVALPTIRNIAGYDMIVASADGRKHANIQVKASAKRVSFWPMPPSEKVRAGSNDYYVLLRWLSKETRFEAFMVTGLEARAEVRRGEKFQRRRARRKTRRVIFPAFYIRGKRKQQSERWRAMWEKWKL